MRFFLIMIALILIGCSSKETSTNEGKYGHWKFKGSSTFQQIFQCVDKFEPHQDQEC